jgi:hypothetical protein
MKTFLLVIVLTLSSGTEQYVAIIMPDEETCETLREAYVYAVDVRNKFPRVVDGLEDPFWDLDDDIRTPINVDEVRCEMHEEES